MKKSKNFLSKKLIFGDPIFELRPMGLGDYELWRDTLTQLPQAKNEWDESAWKKSEVSPAKFKVVLQGYRKEQQADLNYRFMLIDKRSGAWLGVVCFYQVVRGNFQSAFLSYRVFSPYWGQGLATYMVAKATAFAFTKLKLHRLEAAVSPRNRASRKVLVKNGFKLEGLSRKRMLHNGKWQDFEVYAQTN